MKTIRIGLLLSLLFVSASSRAANFNITTPDFYYVTNGGSVQNPTITLVRGTTNTFTVNADPSHPFEIVDKNQVSFNDGVQNNNISTGTITFRVPMTAPSQLRYICSLHAFGGAINITGGPAPDFSVSTPGGAFAYTINNFSGDNPTLTLTRGLTYVFEIDATPDHPFQIIRDLNSGESYDDGVVNNNVAQGRIIFTVPADAPSTLYYICPIHFFGGVINIVDPPRPPAPLMKVISISVGSNIVTLKSLGTNGWSPVPEFTSNLLNPNWLAIPSSTNVYTNGTNITTFNRLEPICGSNVFLRIKNE